MTHELLAEHYDTIDRIIDRIARRHHLSADEADEFGQLVRLKVIADDCEVLRKFEHRSGIRAYLTAVVQNLFLDFRTAKWGKWRPSAEARRQGPLGILLERLIERDALSFSEASQVLRTTHGLEVSDAELDRLMSVLPIQPRRRPVSDEVLATVPHQAPNGEDQLLMKERRRVAARLWAAVEQALAQLDDRDRLILQLHYHEGQSLAGIGRTLGLPQAPLYPHRQQLLARLRQTLEAAGFTPADIAEGLDLPAAAETGETVPSL